MNTSTTSLGWIQLTDLHVGQPKEGGRVENIERALLEDLQRLVAEDHYVDVVFFTGDVAFRGADAEYVRATALLGRILRRLVEVNDAVARARGESSPGAPVLVPVPGNHDLARPAADDARAVLDAFAKRDATAPPLWTATQAGVRDLIERAFGGYARWLDFHDLPFPPDWALGRIPGDRVATIARRGVSLGVLCLNVAYLHFDDGASGKLHIDKSQVDGLTSRLGEWAAEHDFSVVLTHHPPDWLSATARQTFEREILSDHGFLHLYGHAHAGAHRIDPGSAGHVG